MRKTSESDAAKSELAVKLSKLRRSPKIGQIFELFRAEMEQVLRTSTLNKLDKVWYAHLSALENLRADRLSPLEFQKLVLQKRYDEGSYYTVTLLARIYKQLTGFAAAVGVLADDPMETLGALPLVKKAARLSEQQARHRPTLDYRHLRSELKQVLETFRNQCCLRQQLLLEVQLRTILRPGEAVKLKLCDLDLKAHLLTVHQTKTKEMFLIPTTKSLELCLIKAYQHFGSSTEGWIIAGLRDPKNHLSPQTLNKALKDHGYKDVLCAHGLRSVAANFFAKNETKVPPYVAEACLQHSCANAAVVKAYRRDDYLGSRRKAMALYNDWIDGIYAELAEE